MTDEQKQELFREAYLELCQEHGYQLKMQMMPRMLNETILQAEMQMIVAPIENWQPSPNGNKSPEIEVE